MKKIFFIILVLDCFVLHAQIQELNLDYSFPKKYTIANISVEGGGRISPKIIIAFTDLSINQEISVPGEEISKAILNLWKQKLFSDVQIVTDRIDKNNIYLIIKLKTRPRLSRYIFRGVKKSEGEKLKEKTSLVYGEIVTEQLLQNVSNQIKKHYKEKGYYNPSIKIEETPDSLFGNNSLKLDIHINKGNKIKIGEVDITGNSKVSDKKIKKLLKKTKEKQSWNLFRNSKFIETLYEEDKARVISYYNSLGYRDAQIVFDTVYQYRKDLLKVELKIFEGNVYYIRSIKWIGNKKYNTRELSSILRISKGDIYNPIQIEQQLSMNPNGNDVASLYMDDGYLFFNVVPLEIRIVEDSVDLEIRVFEGPQATINKISISGNDRTSDHVILREIRTKPGDKFSRSDIMRSQRELSQLGYFDPEQMNVIPNPNMENGTVDLEYKVAEKPSDQLQLQGGWGAGQFVGSVGFVFSNFSLRKVLKKSKYWGGPLPSGDGQRLSFRFQSNAIYYNSLNFSFTEPWLGGKKPNSFTYSIYMSNYTNGYEKNEEGYYNIRTTGSSAGLGKRLRWPDDYFILQNSLSFQRYDLTNYPLITGFANGFSNNLSLTHILTRNSVDQPIYPRSGSKFLLALQWTPPFSYMSDKDYKTLNEQEKFKWVEYHKWRFEAAWYLKLFDNFVLHANLQYSFLGMYNKDIGITPFERYYLGGDGLTGYSLDSRELISLRGYEGINDKTLTSNGYLSPGASIFNRYTLEIRYPFTLNPNASIYGILFAEAGNSYFNFKKYDPFQVYRALGVGVRIFMPMFGLLGFDWGYGFDEVPGSPDANKGQFHIKIGQQF
jgi:outer membrane protein insertion porin family